MVRVFLLFSVLALVFTSCDKKPEGASTARMTKLLDVDLVNRYNELVSKSTEKVEMYESRMAELILMTNAEMLANCGENDLEFQELINAQSEVIHMKTVFDMERFNFSNQILILAANAVSKEDLLKKVENSVVALDQSAVMYTEAFVKLLISMDQAGLESPLIQELLSEASSASVQPE